MRGRFGTLRRRRLDPSRRRAVFDSSSLARSRTRSRHHHQFVRNFHAMTAIRAPRLIGTTRDPRRGEGGSRRRFRFRREPRIGSNELPNRRSRFLLQLALRSVVIWRDELTDAIAIEPSCQHSFELIATPRNKNADTKHPQSTMCAKLGNAPCLSSLARSVAASQLSLLRVD